MALLPDPKYNGNLFLLYRKYTWKILEENFKK